MKDFLEEQGAAQLYGSKDSTREAFKRGLIENGEVWMDMIRKRNLSFHTYNLDTAREIVSAVREQYYPELQLLLKRLKSLIEGQAP